MKTKGWWVPDALSVGRLLSLPLLLWLLVGVEQSPGAAVDVDRVLAVGLLLAIAASDRLDGYLARRLGVVSRFGSLADALADKAVQLGPLFYFALAGSTAFPTVPLWLPSVLLGLELLVASVWTIAHLRSGRPIPRVHNAAGRTAGLLLFGLLVWITADLPAAGVAPGGVAVLCARAIAVGWYLRDAVGAAGRVEGEGRGNPGPRGR